jgi:phosphoribosylanthranilate isomerase
MTKIKICGITREIDALFCADQGADFLGMIFVPSSPRFIDTTRAQGIAAAVRDHARRPRLVGVFKDAPVETVRQVAANVPLDFVQLHGSESDEDIRAIGVPAIKTCHVGDALPDTTAHSSAAWLLFDTHGPRQEGGTGRRFDWSLLAIYERAKPFLLAGGLTPDNVAGAISLVRPDAVDVASGVESQPGVKDHAKVERLFERIRRA